MKGLKKGPELKMPELKVPDFLSDLYYDLRDRRLLPLVALIVVAIAAVPFLLGDGEEPELPPLAAGGLGVAEGGAGASRLTVVEATPGLRDYRKRLSRRSSTDPFEQRYSAPDLEGAKLNPESKAETGGGGGGESSSKTTSKSVKEMEEDGEVVVTETGTAPPEGGKDGLQFFDLVVDFQISRSETTPAGVERMTPPSVRRRVPPLTPLPGPKAPVVTTMGVNLLTETVLLMVSDDVTSVFGDAECVSGTDSCELLEVPLGFPLTFVYGPNDVRYKIKAVKVDAVWVDEDGKGGAKGDAGANAKGSRVRQMGVARPQNFSK